MSHTAVHPAQLRDAIEAALGSLATSVTEHWGEVTAVVGHTQYHQAAELLHTHAACGFDTLIDLCGVDYATYGEGSWSGPRFAVVLHLLSVRLNQRVRLKVFAPQDDWPVLPTVTDIWAAANWFEREAFDLFGIVFEGHNDLRRILTDYGFIGHPFRKDFPLSGHVEMRYDAEQKRVVYQPITIEPREITPRVIREEGYGSKFKAV